MTREKFGSGPMALIFCLFLIIDKALGLELLLHLPAGEAATALHWK